MINSNTKNNVRMSVSMPWYVHEQLQTHVKQGQMSDFVTKAVQERLSEEKGRKLRKVEAWKEFLELGKTLPRSNFKQIKAAINKGRA